MICLNLMWWPRWWLAIYWYRVRAVGWSLVIHLGPLLLEINNNHVWTLTERLK